jgi:Uma2 family endonuclease
MRAVVEITVPETKPATEWIGGEAVQKVSPQRKHALAQGVFFSALYEWAMRYGSGRVGTEWDFRVQPAGGVRRPLVPDVAYLSYASVPFERAEDADIPRVAPDVVVEVLSPGDHEAHVEEKVGVYLAAGTAVVFLVNTSSRIVVARKPELERTFTESDDVTDESLPGFAMPVRALLEEPQPRR